MIMVPTWIYRVSVFVLLLSLVASETIFVDERANRSVPRRNTTDGDPLVMNGPTSSDSTLKTPSVSSGELAADTDVVPAPAGTSQRFVRLFAVWGIFLLYLVRSRRREAGAVQVSTQESTEPVTRSRQITAECMAEKTPLYREVLDGYNRLKDGAASSGEVDKLRRSARSFLEGRDGEVKYERREVKELLDWLDNARTSGRITITVQQLRERKMGSWDIECGIDAGGQTIKAKRNVNGNAEVAGCVLNVPWDANGGIKVWMHLTDSGYETCWGHFGPIAMSSAEVLQDPSGMARAFYTDQFDKDFKLVFKIQRNFSPLPCFADDMGALTDAAALKASR